MEGLEAAFINTLKDLKKNVNVMEKKIGRHEKGPNRKFRVENTICKMKFPLGGLLETTCCIRRDQGTCGHTI